MAQLEREPPAKTEDLSSIMETRVVVNQLPQAILTCAQGPVEDEINNPPPTPNINKVKTKIFLKKVKD